MSGADPPGSENLKGLSKIFNSQTNYGRANVRIFLHNLNFMLQVLNIY